MDIFGVPVKNEINTTIQGKSIMVVGKSKTGKSTICSKASRPVFLMTENGTEGLTGFTPIPIKTWVDFKAAVNQLTTAKGRETFDTVVIDTYTNLITLLDRYVGQKMSDSKNTIDFGSDADYGKGTRPMKSELTLMLQKLTDEGYLVLNIVHAEDKVDFNTKKEYIGTSLSATLYGVAEKAVDQIIYLSRKEVKGQIEYRTHFNIKGGFDGTGGRYVTDVDSVETGYENIKTVLERAFSSSAVNQGATAVTAETQRVVIGTAEDYNFEELVAEFQSITERLVEIDSATWATRIKNIVDLALGAGKKVSSLNATQAELLAGIISDLKDVAKDELNQ